jgi:diguanylate cyclase (GGDEF)-like protein
MTLTTPAPTRPVERVVADAALDLAGTTSGIEFVYRTLDHLKETAGATDLLAVVEAPTLGRQVFRAGRGAIEGDWARDVLRRGGVGVHSLPPTVDEETATTVVQLCSFALRLDVARHDAGHDHLTGLLNRRAFDETFAATCAQHERYGWPFALVLADIDGFKDVNDRLGHAVGDATLQAVGHAMARALRGGDAAARLGGDEFALVLANVREVDSRALAERVEAGIEAVVPDAKVTLSVGVAFAPQHGSSPEVLYRQADADLYRRKRRCR